MRGRRAPTGGRAIALASVLSLVLPGLGHVYLGRFGRALIWFAGALVIGGILNQEGVGTATVLIMLGVLALCAAADAVLVLVMGPRTPEG
jgi:TM2 domain-containing membrane protein YozV